jgi:hypothetical protein
LPEYKSSDEYINFRMAKEIFERDVKRFYVKRTELDEKDRAFEEKNYILQHRWLKNLKMK